MFSDSTLKLMRVMGTYQSWLGHSYTTMLQAFECEGNNNALINRVRLSCHARGLGFELETVCYISIVLRGEMKDLG